MLCRNQDCRPNFSESVTKNSVVILLHALQVAITRILGDVAPNVNIECQKTLASFFQWYSQHGQIFYQITYLLPESLLNVWSKYGPVLSVGVFPFPNSNDFFLSVPIFQSHEPFWNVQFKLKSLTKKKIESKWKWCWWNCCLKNNEIFQK